MTTIDDQLLRIERIFLEPEVEHHQRGREILARFPAAERIEVKSHWNIPGLHGNEGLAEDWLRIKRDVLVLGVRKSLTARANGRSSHWVAASAANGWQADYDELLRQLDAALSPAAKAQLAAEVIFLTHNEQLHEVNLRWHPKAEASLWRPALQERKRSETGGLNVRYKAGPKQAYVRALCEQIAERLPYCRVRYAF